jgi:hypothetical protein
MTTHPLFKSTHREKKFQKKTATTPTMNAFKGALNSVSEKVHAAVDGVKGQTDGLSVETVAQALTDALETACSKATGMLSAPGGFLDNESRHIHLPNDDIGGVLEKCKPLPGMGAKIKELEVTMNKAAEVAVKGAIAIFLAAIKALNYEDAMALLKGHAKAATDYFQKVTTKPLTDLFYPIVQAALQELGCVAIYEQILEVYAKIPFAPKAPKYDLANHVTTKGLGSLFVQVGHEENEIREKPALRNTKAMQDAFGSLTTAAQK